MMKMKKLCVEIGVQIVKYILKEVCCLVIFLVSEYRVIMDVLNDCHANYVLINSDATMNRFQLLFMIVQNPLI